jgi:hypothetical protein
MRRRRATGLLCLLGLLGLLLSVGACASVRTRGFERLPEAEKARFARYRQFMTDRQQERFLLLSTQEERDAFIGDMHVDERLSLFPPHVREAIWSREVAPGMTKDAVMLSWGAPERVSRREDPLNKGLPERETWSYPGRGEVVFVEELVIEVVP